MFWLIKAMEAPKLPRTVLLLLKPSNSQIKALISEPVWSRVLPARLMMKPVTEPQLPQSWQELFSNKDLKKLNQVLIQLILKEVSIKLLTLLSKTWNPDQPKLEEDKPFLMSQLFQLTETDKSETFWLISTKRSVFTELSPFKKERPFIMKPNSLMVWDSTEDTFHHISSLMKRNKKLNSITVTFSLLKRNYQLSKKSSHIWNTHINNKNHCWSSLKTLKANYWQLW